MLHEIKLPEYHTQLREVLDFQEKVLRFACTPSIDSSLNTLFDNLKQTFGSEAGEWFFERLYNLKEEKWEETRLYKEFKKLIDYIEADPEAGQRILDAFIHDKDFYNYMDDENFRFHQKTLSTVQEADLKAVKSLMIAFYEILFRNVGFPEDTHPNTGTDTIRRKDWNKAFWRENSKLRVCPFCDKERPDKINETISSDLDHFFPKESYPFFSVHPDNLVPGCLECNQRAKKTDDPIDNHEDAPLVNCFHPYHRHAIDYIEVTGCTDTVGKFKVNIREKDGSLSRRVKNLNALLNLEERWTGRLQDLIDEIIESLELRSKEEFQERLNDEFEYISGRFGRKANSFVYHNLLRYILDTPSELDVLWEVVERN